MVAAQAIEAHLFVDPAAVRVPAAVSFSLVLHVAGMAGFLWLAEKEAKVDVAVISGVELLFDRKTSPVRRRRKVTSMKDFLKMALPARPRRLRSLDVNAPKLRRKPLEIQKLKLKDRGKLDTGPKMKIDMGKRRIQLAKLDQALARRKSRSLAALPKLEEVGRLRAAPKVLAAAKLSEERSDRMRAMGLDANISLGRRSSLKAAPLLAEAAGRPSALERLASVLPEASPRLSEASRPMPVKRLARVIEDEPAPPPVKKAVALEGIKKKAVEIEGPLSNRKVVAFSLPKFPQWAADQGMVEADVAIKFYVDPEGDVIEDRMRVERTSGYGRLDRLALKHLKLWRFQPLPLSQRSEWGIITFRFILE